MRVSAIQFIQRNDSVITNKSVSNNSSTYTHSINNYCIYPIPTFTFGIANSSKLKNIFTYGVPCMYSGIEMIDPRQVQRLLKNNIFTKDLGTVVSALKPFEKSLTGIELKVYKIIKSASKQQNTKTVSEYMQELVPKHETNLKKKQLPILNKIDKLTKKLPDEDRYNFTLFMDKTYKKIDNIPVIENFSTTDFQYKLAKISEGIKNTNKTKSRKVITKIINEANKLSPHTNSSTIDNQKSVIKFLKIILKKSILKDNPQLNDILNRAEQCLNQERAIVPFSRKAFIYDLSKMLTPISDNTIQEKIIALAKKLPTSNENISAYIVKSAKEPSEKIIYRLLWPSMASIEHIYPRSCGGVNETYNFGGACTRENSNRQNIPFISQIEKKPETKKNCQKYIDRLIALANMGIFKKNNFSIKYIYDFKNTIEKYSNGMIKLDISALQTSLYK